MSEAEQYRVAYNAHEEAESAALGALWEILSEQSLDALACLADPNWGWEARSFISGTISEYASEILNDKLNKLVAA